MEKLMHMSPYGLFYFTRSREEKIMKLSLGRFLLRKRTAEAAMEKLMHMSPDGLFYFTRSREAAKKK